MMDILEIARQWAKEEIIFSRIFVFAAILFFIVSIGFWKFGSSELARSYIYPTLICGTLLLVIGCGLIITDSWRYRNFSTKYINSPIEFVKSEIERTESTAAQSYRTIYRVIPIIVIVASLLVIFVDRAIVRSSSITIIAFMAVLLFVDSNAHSRIEVYNRALRARAVELYSHRE